jgi:hypothetical protein
MHGFEQINGSGIWAGRYLVDCQSERLAGITMIFWLDELSL